MANKEIKIPIHPNTVAMRLGGLSEATLVLRHFKIPFEFHTDKKEGTDQDGNAYTELTYDLQSPVISDCFTVRLMKK